MSTGEREGGADQDPGCLPCAGVGERMARESTVHHGINLAFEGGLHRIDLTGLSGGRSVVVYPQHEVLVDLIGQRLADGGDLRFGVADVTYTERDVEYELAI